MPQPLFVIEVMGAEQYVRGLDRFTEGIQDLRPAWLYVAPALRTAIQQQFESEGGHGGQGWAPLNPRYAAWKEAQHSGQPLLVISGRMRGSLVGTTPDTIYEARPLSLRLGTRVPYASFHQRGTRKMPARPIIQLSEADKRGIDRALLFYLSRRAIEQGLL